MVSETYSESRRAMAKKISLGLKPGQSPKAAQAIKAEAKPARKGKSISDAKAAAQAHLGGSSE